MTTSTARSRRRRLPPRPPRTASRHSRPHRRRALVPDRAPRDEAPRPATPARRAFGLPHPQDARPARCPPGDRPLSGPSARVTTTWSGRSPSGSGWSRPSLVARLWNSSPDYVRRRLRQLVAADLLVDDPGARAPAASPQRAPRLWSPERPSPMRGRRVIGCRPGGSMPPVPTTVYLASRHAAHLFGGSGGRFAYPLQATHDLHVAALYVRLAAVAPDDLARWRGRRPSAPAANAARCRTRSSSTSGRSRCGPSSSAAATARTASGPSTGCARTGGSPTSSGDLRRGRGDHDQAGPIPPGGPADRAGPARSSSTSASTASQPSRCCTACSGSPRRR